MISQLTKEILELHSKKLTNKEISLHLNISIKKVISDLNRHKLKSNRYKNIEENNELKQFLLGSILGDGHITKVKYVNENSKISFGHGDKQKDYCLYKHNFLEKFDLATKFGFYESKNNRYKNSIKTYAFKSKSHPIFSKYKKLFYSNNIKYINRDYIQELDNFGLAIWFMDDGNKATYGYTLYTCSFSKEDVLFLKDLLINKFNLDVTYHNFCNSIYIKSNSVVKFNSLIEKFVIPSMKYKLHNREVLDKSGELLESPMG